MIDLTFSKLEDGGDKIEELDIYPAKLGDIYVPIDYFTALCNIPGWGDVDLYMLTYLMCTHKIYKSPQGEEVRNYFRLSDAKKEEGWKALDKYNRVCNSHWHVYRFTVKGKVRIICDPMPLLKKLLRGLNEWLQQIPLLECFYGFVRGRKIADCVKPLAGCQVVYSVDVKNAFPSVTQRKLHNLFRKKWGMHPEVCKLFSELATHYNRLPIGSPASPMLWNHWFQEFVIGPVYYELNKRGYVLCIWADNIFIGRPGATSYKKIMDVVKILKEACSRHHLELHKEQIKYSGDKKPGALGMGIPDPGDGPEPSIRAAMKRFDIREQLYKILDIGIEAFANEEGISVTEYKQKINGIFSAWKSMNAEQVEYYLEIWEKIKDDKRRTNP